MRDRSPPTTGPCYYGIDTPTRAELIAANHTRRGDPPDDRRGQPLRTFRSRRSARIEASMKHGFCDACFSGEYVIPVDEVAVADAQLPLFESAAADAEPDAS